MLGNYNFGNDLIEQTMDFDKKLAEFDEKIIEALKDNTAMMKLATETTKDLLAVLSVFDVDVSQ